MTVFSASQLRALSDMQIPVWQLRTTDVPEQTAVHRPTAEQFAAERLHVDKPVLFVSAQSLSTAERRLFDNIVQAVQCPPTDYQLIETAISVQSLVMADSCAWLVWLGLPTNDTAETRLTQISCPALADILASPSLKLAVWQQLKGLREQFV